jgi:hypothetical protein
LAVPADNDMPNPEIQDTVAENDEQTCANNKPGKYVQHIIFSLHFLDNDQGVPSPGEPPSSSSDSGKFEPKKKTIFTARF